MKHGLPEELRYIPCCPSAAPSTTEGFKTKVLAHVCNGAIEALEGSMTTPRFLPVKRRTAHPAVSFLDLVQPLDEDGLPVMWHVGLELLFLEPIQIGIYFPVFAIDLPFLLKGVFVGHDRRWAD